MRLRVEKQVYGVVTVLVRFDRVMELTQEHCTKKQLGSEVHPVLFCSTREVTVRSEGLVTLGKFLQGRLQVLLTHLMKQLMWSACV